EEIHGLPPITAWIYSNGFINCSPASKANLNNGPAPTPIKTVIVARKAIGYNQARIFISIPAGDLDGNFQNASTHNLCIQKSVRIPIPNAIATRIYCSVANPARTKLNISKNPDSGVKPTNDIAGIRNNNASK